MAKSAFRDVTRHVCARQADLDVQRLKMRE